MHILCVNALKLLSVFFGTRSGFFGEDRLATLLHGTWCISRDQSMWLRHTYECDAV